MMAKRVLKIVALLFLTFAGIASHGFDFFGEKITEDDFKRIKADKWNLVGKNVIASGNVHIPFGNFEVRADQAVLNLESYDLEAVGNISLHRWQTAQVFVDPGELEELSHRTGLRIKVIGSTGDIWGKRKIHVEVARPTDSISAQRIAGNLKTGYLSFNRAKLRFRNLLCTVESGERRPDGVFILNTADLSACGYLEYGNAHYSLGAKQMTLTPFAPESFDLKEKDFGSGTGDYSVWLTNGWMKIYGVPLLWLPAFYKPRDESPGISSVVFGRTGDWGYYVSLRKRFRLMDYPASSVQLGDYYSRRGFGYGVNGHFDLDNSRTYFMAYSIYDNHPYSESDYHKYLLKVPNNRYNFRVSNVSHITPRLDFRAAAEFTSDYFFTRDFFNARYSADPQPSSYAALEQQFDIFSASLYFRMQVNRFYSTVEKIPEVRIDLHRQQIFNTPLYYQGDLSASYMRMRWIKFDKKHEDMFYLQQWARMIENEEDPETTPMPKFTLKNYKLDDYESFRLDTTHFIYLPLQKYGFSLIPRAGFKITAYSNSSKNPVSSSDLLRLITAADPTTSGMMGNLNNYDQKGGSKVRLVGELGFEASFKIHNTWQDVRSDLLGIDGLRHVMRPYINYTYISDPTVDRKYLLYFDDIDRIEKENFFRFGLENRLQTRDSDSKLREYFSMENYLDIHLEKSSEDSDLSNVGNFCTKLAFQPIRGLTLSTEFSIDLGGNNEEVEPYKRHGGRERKPGLNAKWLNRWNLTVSYEPAKDFVFTFSYEYFRPYIARSAYSMGSTFALLDAGSYFNCYRSKRTETFNFGVKMPLTPDRRTFGSFNLSYDVLKGGISSVGFMLIRQFHCVELIASLVFDRDDDEEKGASWDTNFSVQLRLLGLEMPVRTESNRMLSRANDVSFGNSDRSKSFW